MGRHQVISGSNMEKLDIDRQNAVPDHLRTDEGSEHRTAVVVASCFRYRQVWRPFFTLFHRYWPDCPYRVFFVSDTGGLVMPMFEGVENIGFPRDNGWCSTMITALEDLPFDRIILFQEDFLLTAPVETQTVRRLVQYAHDEDVGCLRLCPCPGPNRRWKDSFLGEIGLDAEYRVSLQLAIWKRSVLLGLMRHGEIPWAIEANGRQRSAGIKEPFLSIWRELDDAPGGPVRYFITAVTRGAWERGALELLRREGIPMDGITGRIP
jgi:hypothetical protein